MKKCPICKMPDDTFKAGVVNGKFISERCATCFGLYSEGYRGELASAATFRREKDRENHRRDLIQPYHKGQPNPEFIRAYPDQAKEYFTEEELIKYQ